MSHRSDVRRHAHRRRAPAPFLLIFAPDLLLPTCAPAPGLPSPARATALRDGP